MTELRALGDALEASVRHDLQARRRRRPARSLALIAAVLAIVIPGAAIAAAHFLSNEDVARSLPAGSLILAGTEPSCTTVRQDEEYHCVLARAPADAAQAGLIKGTVYETVDSTQHVNGGCRSLNAAGTEWECYIGEEAVRQKIISQGFLGEVQTTPAVG
jgi:hypothetical protein